MTDKEAIKTIEYTRAFNEKHTKLMDALDMAITALQEREERSKGCILCYTDAKYNPFVGGYNYCPMCGRKLKGENE